MVGADRFGGRVALVTGGAGDIGSAVARRLGREGARIVLTDLDEVKLRRVGDGLRDTGVSTFEFVADVTDFDAVERMVAFAEEEAGPIDLLFNNAGYQGAFRPTHEYPTDDFPRVIAVNLVGAFYVLRAVGERMVSRRRGAIVNTASMAKNGPPNMAAYAASKAGLLGLSATAAKDFAPHGVRVNSISPAFMGPGYMWDRQVQLQAEAGSKYYPRDPAAVAEAMIGEVPMGRYGDIEEIPGVVAFLLSDDASYLTGTNTEISGGIV